MRMQLANMSSSSITAKESTSALSTAQVLLSSLGFEDQQAAIQNENHIQREVDQELRSAIIEYEAKSEPKQRERLLRILAIEIKRITLEHRQAVTNQKKFERQIIETEKTAPSTYFNRFGNWIASNVKYFFGSDNQSQIAHYKNVAEQLRSKLNALETEYLRVKSTKPESPQLASKDASPSGTTNTKSLLGLSSSGKRVAPTILISDMRGDHSPNQEGDIEISGNKVFLAAYQNYKVFDITNPLSPVWLTTKTNFPIRRLYVATQNSYCAGGGGMYCLGTSGTYDMNGAYIGYPDGAGYGIDTGPYAGQKTVAIDNHLQVLDASNVANIKLKKDYTLPGAAYDLLLNGFDVHVAMPNLGLYIYNFQDYLNPSLRGSCSASGLRRIVKSGNYVYGASGNSGLRIFDVSNPSNPRIVSTLITGGSAHAVTVIYNCAYVLQWQDKFVVADVANPLSPILMDNNVTLPGVDIQISGNVGYVIGELGGLYVVNNLLPNTPPTLTNNKLTINSRQSALITTDFLQAGDVDTPPYSLIFNIINNSNCYFYLNSNPLLNITSFNQDQIFSNLIYVASVNNRAPSYLVTVDDGYGPIPQGGSFANVTFIYGNDSSTVENTAISSTIYSSTGNSVSTNSFSQSGGLRESSSTATGSAAESTLTSTGDSSGVRSSTATETVSASGSTRGSTPSNSGTTSSGVNSGSTTTAGNTGNTADSSSGFERSSSGTNHSANDNNSEDDNVKILVIVGGSVVGAGLLVAGGIFAYKEREKTRRENIKLRTAQIERDKLSQQQNQLALQQEQLERSLNRKNSEYKGNIECVVLNDDAQSKLDSQVSVTPVKNRV